MSSRATPLRPRSTAALLALLALTACGATDVREQSREALRSDAKDVGRSIAAALGRGESSELELRAAVRVAVGARAVVVGTAGDEGVSVEAVLTTGTQTGGGLSYDSWRSRACVRYEGRVGQGVVTLVDIGCPALVEPDPGPADEVLPVG